MKEAVASAVTPAVWDTTVLADVKLTAQALLPVFYADLKRIAHWERVKVGAGSTLQTTALVHEAYLKMHASDHWNDDTHFLRSAALAMRHALISHALERLTAKRGQGAEHVSLTEGLNVAAASDASLVQLDDALQLLARQSLRLAQVVECRFFAGYDDRETAQALGLSERTVRRDWTLARAWLLRELQAD